MVAARIKAIECVRDEAGYALVQTAIAIFLMLMMFFSVINIGLAYYSASELESELASAITRSDISKLVSVGSEESTAVADAAFKEEILDNSTALSADNLTVENTTVTLSNPLEESVAAREVEGSSATTVTRITTVAHIESDVTYTAPVLTYLSWLPEITFTQHVSSDQSVENRIEVS